MSDFKAKCTEFDFRLGPRPYYIEKHRALPSPLAVLRGLLIRGGERKGREKERRGGKEGPWKCEAYRAAPAR